MKVLSLIVVWILFIVGCSWIIETFVSWAAAGFGTGDWQASVAGEAIGITALLFSVIAMKLRKDLE